MTVYSVMLAMLRAREFATAICPEKWNSTMGLTVDTESSSNLVGCRLSSIPMSLYPDPTMGVPGRTSLSMAYLVRVSSRMGMLETLPKGGGVISKPWASREATKLK